MSKIFALLLVSPALVVSAPTLAESGSRWTLSTSTRHVLKVAPEMKTAEAEIGVQLGKLEQAGAWPNPSVSVQVDNTLGLDDGAVGYGVTQLAISQPLPFGRLTRQRQQAKAGLASAQARRHHRQLILEYKVARRFHILQLAEAKLQLAEERLQQAHRYQQTGRHRFSGDPLIRYLTPLEIMRLDIVLQAAKQTADVAEGEFNEAAASFRALLHIPDDGKLSLMSLTSVPITREFTVLENSLQSHPALEADKQTIASLTAGVAVARSQRFDDPTLTFFRGEGFYASRRQNDNGVMLSIQVPLWNRNNGGVTQARYAVHRAQAALDLRQRELRTALHKSYLHLGHLIKQAEHFRNKMLQPAQKVFALTRKGFRAGELNILTLIDANNTWFDAQERYFELLQESWQELAEVRRSAGLSLLTNSPMSNSGADSGEVK